MLWRCGCLLVARIPISYRIGVHCQCLIFYFFFSESPVFDRQGIYKRFSSCYPTDKPTELARLLGLKQPTVQEWKSGKNAIPWQRLKKVVYEHGLSWDWLIEGREPKHQRRTAEKAEQPFDRHGINQRFLSLLPNCSNAKLGKELGVRDTTIFKWRHDMEQVAWERLKYAVDTKGVTWEWLLEGTDIF